MEQRLFRALWREQGPLSGRVTVFPAVAAPGVKATVEPRSPARLFRATPCAAGEDRVSSVLRHTLFLRVSVSETGMYPL